MPSDRDTLAELIGADVDRQIEVHASYISHLDQHELADAVIAAGWRPPARTVTDPAEMDSWPLGTVVRGYGVAHQNVPGHVAGDPPLWIKPTGRLQTSAELLADCRGAGVTVLYQPEEETDDDDQ
ncbi:hypothetical protein [Nocardia cyriacigeorgica]|uniref:hypothetical protein n=1 Tax=Nocardia cyriacigeorgica TaxID=135487 RepID=UPI002457C59E|nr:hypothetical protein [Nocardia cyriacigeorgica]